MTGVMSSPDWSSTVIWYQVSYISRPYTPRRVSMLVMTVLQSSANSSDGRPSTAIRPPWAMFGDHRVQRVRAARHLEADVEPLGHPQLALHVGQVALARVDRQRSRPSAGPGRAGRG